MPIQEADPRRAQAFELRQQGKPYKDIALHFGISEQTLTGWLYRERNARARQGLKGLETSGNSAALSPNIPGLNQSGLQLVKQSADMAPAGNSAVDFRSYKRAQKAITDRLSGKDVDDKVYQSAKDFLAQWHKDRKGKAPETDPEAQRTAYRGMGDAELVERTLASAVKVAGLDTVKGMLRKLEETGQLDNG